MPRDELGFNPGDWMAFNERTDEQNEATRQWLISENAVCEHCHERPATELTHLPKLPTLTGNPPWKCIHAMITCVQCNDWLYAAPLHVQAEIIAAFADQDWENYKKMMWIGSDTTDATYVLNRTTLWSKREDLSATQKGNSEDDRSAQDRSAD